MSEDLTKIYKGPSGEFVGTPDSAPVDVPLETVKIVKPAVKESVYFTKGEQIVELKQRAVVTERRGPTPTGKRRVKTQINERRVPVREPVKPIETRNLQLERFGPVIATVEPVVQNLDIDPENN